jgi:nitrite reductase [NAD(P)H] large subunit
MSEPLVVIGNGMAAARLVDEIAKRALGRYAIAVIGEEPLLAYNRVLLSALLADEVSPTDVELKPARWWRDRGVTLRYGSRATAVDVAGQTITLANGGRLDFSKAVFATGSRPIRLTTPGMELPGVMTFRDIYDVSAMRAQATPGAPVVVIGGGLLGLEAAHGLVKSGASVTLVHLMDRLMERQLDAAAADMLRRAVEARGVKVLLEAETARVVGSRRVEAIELKDGRTLPAALVVVAVGVRPNATPAAEAGIAVNRGIIVDDHLETSAPGVFAIGECAEHRGVCYGLVQPGYEQADVLARRLAGEEVRYPGSILATNLKVSGVDVFSAGDFLGSPGTESIVLHDPGLGIYRKLVIAQDRLVGAVLCGDNADATWYLELIRSGRPIGAVRDDLAFGRALADRAAAA